MPRRPFKARPHRPNIGKPDVPVFSRATVLDNGLIGEKPLSRTVFETSRFIPSPTQAENDLYALNTLQLRRGWPLEQLSLQIPLEYLRDTLPPGAKRIVGIAMCGSPYVFNCAEDNLDRRIRKMYHRWQAFWDIFHSSEYVFWPIETERGYFVTALFHMEKGLMDDPNFDPDEDPNADIPQVENPHFTVVGAWSVIDPQRGQAAQDRAARIIDRIQRIFAAEGITFDPGSYREHQAANGDRWALPWVPPPSEGDDWSSGIRSFALVQELINRIISLYCSELGFTESYFNVPLNGWLNVDQVRHQMMGICAINAIEDMGWNARLAIECIQQITTVEGIPPFNARSLAATDQDKAVYIPETDINGVPQTVP
ncbi:hypothetical protein ONZ43_g4944 [Nemania bipapillata]|uniref:Uncharacterized protein n=1 Tax=Nemania bipapillata TaxID=110536 RepID=A0ACC2IGJ2_9PEZI|nr:hypothetical protein ONZ43_g4944 [Nemania bipapillata]